MKYRIIFLLVAIAFFLTSCQQNDHSEVLCDPEALPGPDEIEVTDENFRQINQPSPRIFNRSGES